MCLYCERAVPKCTMGTVPASLLLTTVTTGDAVPNQSGHEMLRYILRCCSLTILRFELVSRIRF